MGQRDVALVKVTLGSIPKAKPSITDYIPVSLNKKKWVWDIGFSDKTQWFR